MYLVLSVPVPGTVYGLRDKPGAIRLCRSATLGKVSRSVRDGVGSAPRFARTFANALACRLRALHGPAPPPPGRARMEPSRLRLEMQFYWPWSGGAGKDSSLVAPPVGGADGRAAAPASRATLLCRPRLPDVVGGRAPSGRPAGGSLRSPPKKKLALRRENDDSPLRGGLVAPINHENHEMTCPRCKQEHPGFEITPGCYSAICVGCYGRKPKPNPHKAASPTRPSPTTPKPKRNKPNRKPRRH